MTNADLGPGTSAVDADKKVSVGTLTAMVVGSIVGSGVFVLPRRFGTETGGLGALIAWTIAGSGMFMLALVFKSLAIRKPDLNAGIFAYAKAGFGDYVGFNAAFGYWASAVAGTVSYWVLTMSTLGAIFPALGRGETVLAIALSSVGVWIFHFLVLRGVHAAAAINRIVAIAKMVPIAVFIIVGIIMFKAGVFADNFWGGPDHSFSAIFQQAKGTMLITVFVSWESKAPASIRAMPAGVRTSVRPLCSASCRCCRCSCSSPWCPTAPCPNTTWLPQPRRRWRPSWNHWWAPGVRCSSRSA